MQKKIKIVDVFDCSDGGSILSGVLQFVVDLIRELFLILPNIVTGINALGFIHKCQHYTPDLSLESRADAKNLLTGFKALKEGCQYILFVMFVGYTIFIIGVSYLLAMQINGCMTADPLSVFSYAALLLQAVFSLLYYGLNMEDCFDQFQNIGDQLR